MRLVYISPVPWASFAQRPHKFVEWFHTRFGGHVLWIDPYPTRLPALGDSRRINMRPVGGEVKIPTWLTVVLPGALPIEPIAGSGFLNRVLWRDVLLAVDKFVVKGDCRVGVGKPSVLALQVLARTSGCTAFYDAMDDFPAFYKGLSRKAMERRERAVARGVSQILASSSALLNRFAAHRPKVTLVRNACAADMLASVYSLRKSRSTPILGYVGTIGHWFDWQLVCEIAKQNPSLHVQLIGPVYSSPPGSLPGNVELLSACDHATAIRAMQQFSAGLIPFKRTDLTASVDPIKYYEYRALGMPVLSTRFGEMALRDEAAGVFLMDVGLDLRSIVDAALGYECEMEAVQEFRIKNSWEARFDASSIAPAPTPAALDTDLELNGAGARSHEVPNEKIVSAVR